MDKYNGICSALKTTSRNRSIASAKKTGTSSEAYESSSRKPIYTTVRQF
jgi:hypothetical protein